MPSRWGRRPSGARSPRPWGSETEPPELWAFLADVMTGQSTRDVLIEHPFGRTTESPMRFSGHVVSSDGDRLRLAVISMMVV